MRGSKTGMPSLFFKQIRTLVQAITTPMRWFGMGVFLLPLFGCVMTKAQGDMLAHQVREMEDEMAKLQRVRHDMEVLLIGQVRDLIDRLAKLESQLAALRSSWSEGSLKNAELMSEIQNLRGQLEEAQHRYRNLEQDQQSLAKNQLALKEAQNKIRIPPLKEDHFALAKKYYLGGKFDEAIQLFEEFIKNYPSETDLCGQSYYLLGEIYRKLGDSEKTTAESEKLYKKSVIFYQKIIEQYSDSGLREESLYKIGLVLKTLGNKDGAQSAFKELLAKHADGKRVKEAKKQLAELAAKSK